MFDYEKEISSYGNGGDNVGNWHYDRVCIWQCSKGRG